MTSAVNAAPSLHPKEQPDVSVIVDALNSVNQVGACLDSVLAQCEDGLRVEVLAFDRGSEDGTRETLRQWAAQHPALVRFAALAPSDSPAEGRNFGIEQSTGRHLFFLGGTDQLAPGALKRMVRSADEDDADVVLGKVEGLDGQKVGSSMFVRDSADADLYTSRVYWSLSADKLFRRTLVERCFLRFPADWRLGEDQVFTALAYLYADRVAVVADMVCVKQAKRVAGVNTSRYAGSLAERMALTRQLIAMVAERVPPGPARDHLMARHFEVELAKATGAAYRACEDPESRWRAMSECRDLLEAYATPAVFLKLPRPLSVRLELIRQGRFAEAERLISFELDREKAELLIEGGRVFRRFPFFRDPEVGLPDEFFEITHTLRAKHRLNRLSWSGTTLNVGGHGYIEQLPTRAPGLKVVLRERRTGAEHRFRVYSTPSPKLNAATKMERGGAGFEARLDLSGADGYHPITPGLWDMYLYVCYQGVGKEVRFGGVRAAAVLDQTRQGIVVAPLDATGLETVAHLYATKAGNLTVEVSSRRPLPTGDGR
ncbi:glycosyltransferase family 2 protein [Streptomyces sp. ISL-43]|uniref:glycosyltransferase family 2 protein n=1 Tax=Streptomyces sp. ISL-43 TaxID=2819183 RepID=UPI001BE832E3|nr:glycosyltransferase family 2 protein [Streptomyces sp. ISL-43]MBT2452051.1 glycosyltransferase family 2 protein [Streptomyces sp. ISL-43]